MASRTEPYLRRVNQHLEQVVRDGVDEGEEPHEDRSPAPAPERPRERFVQASWQPRDEHPVTPRKPSSLDIADSRVHSGQCLVMCGAGREPSALRCTWIRSWSRSSAIQKVP